MEVEYTTLTRRELQALCKQHGLPANLTNVRMAENLASILQKKPPREEIKLRGCLRGYGGSSGDDSGSGGGAPKKVRFFLQEEDGEQERGQRDQNVGASPARTRSSRRRCIIDCASKEGNEPAAEAESDLEVKTRSKQYRSGSDAVDFSSIVEKRNSRKRNHEADEVEKNPCTNESYGRKPNTKIAENPPITRVLRNRMVTVEGSQASEGGERKQTRRNVKKKEEQVSASVLNVSLGAKAKENVEDLGNKSGSKQRKGGIGVVLATGQNASIVSQLEEPPLRRSKRNLSKSCNVLQGTEELKISSVLEGSDAWKVENTAGQETEEPVKLPRRSNRANGIASRIRESDPHNSLSCTCETLNGYPKEQEQKKERKSAKNAEPFVSLPDVLFTAAKDVRKEKLPDVEEPSRRVTRNSSALIVLENDSSLSNICKFVPEQKITRKVERNKKIRNEASDNMVAGFTTGDSLQQSAFQADGKALLPSKKNLRRSIRNASMCPSTKSAALIPIKSPRNEDKEILPKNTAPELMFSERAKNSDRVRQTLDKPQIVDFSGGFTVGAEDGVREGDNHFETLKRKHGHSVAKGGLVIAAVVAVEKSGTKKRKRSSCLEDDSLIANVGTYTGSDSANASPGNASSDATKDILHEENCEAISDYDLVASGMHSPCLTEILTEELPNFCSCNQITVDVTSCKKQISDNVLENPSWNRINGEHQIEKDKIYPHGEVETVAYLDSHEMPKNVDCFPESAQPSLSADLSVQNLFPETRESSFSDSSVNIVKSSPPIGFSSTKYLHNQLVNLGGFSQVKDLQVTEDCVDTDAIFKHIGENTAEMVKEDQELCLCNVVEMPYFILNSSCVKDVRNDVTIDGDSRNSESITCTKITMDDESYLGDRSAQQKETNVAKLCQSEESSAVADKLASSLSDPLTVSMPVNVHGPEEISSYSPICASSLKEQAALSLIPLPGNDLLDMFGKEAVSKNEFRSCKFVSFMSSTAETGRNELHGLEELCGSTVYSGNPQRHEAAEGDGFFIYSPSNLLTNTSENAVESSGVKHQVCSENKDSHFLETDAVPHFHPSKITQDGEIVIPTGGNQNSCMNITCFSTSNTITQYDYPRPIGNRREFSPLRFVEVSRDMTEASLKVEDAGRAVLGSNFDQSHENRLSLPVDFVTFKKHTEYSRLSVNSEENSCSGVLGVISITKSDILGKVSHTVLQMEGAREIHSEGKSSDKILASLKAEREFEKQVEALKGASEIIHSKSSASSIVSCEKESNVDIAPCINESGNNKSMEEVMSPSSIGGISQLKPTEAESVEKEDPVDAISLCADNINSSSMYRSFDSGKISGRKMSNEKSDIPGNVLIDKKKNHIFICCFSTSENGSEGKFGGDKTTTPIPDTGRKNGEDSTDINNLNVDFEVMAPLEDHQLELIGSPLYEVLSIGRNSCPKDGFSELKHASCESKIREESDASNKVPSSPSILMENLVIYNGDTTKPNKSENSAALESVSLLFQSPCSDSLSEMKYTVENVEVKNGGLDASNGFFSVEHEIVKSLSKESNIIMDDKEVVFHLNKPSNSPRTHGFCGEFQTSSYIGETSARAPDGQDSPKFEDKIFSDHVEEYHINERFKFSIEEKIDEDVPMVLCQEAGCMSIEDNEADKTKDLGEEMEMDLSKCAGEEDEKEQLISLCNKEDNQNINFGSRNSVNVQTELVQSEQELDINNLIPCNAVSQPEKCQLDDNQSTPEVPEEALDALAPKAEVVSLIPDHSESEEISKTNSLNYTGLNKLGCDSKANENILTDGDLDTKSGEIFSSLQQQNDGTDNTDESCKQLVVSQTNTDLAVVEEQGMEISINNENNANFKIDSCHKEDKSALESPGGPHSHNKVFGIGIESKLQEAWVAPGASLPMIEDLFHVETKQPLIAQPDDISADDSAQHDCGYSSGRSRDLNLIENMEIESFESDVGVGKYEEQTTFDTMNDDLKTNSDGIVESVSENAAAGCSGSKSPDRAEHLESKQVFEEISLKETVSAIQDEDRNSMECPNTVSEKYLAAEENFKEEQNAEGTLVVFRDAKKLQSTSVKNHIIQDLAVASEFVSIPGKLVIRNDNAACEMEKSCEVLTGHDYNASHRTIRSSIVADDACIPGEALSLPGKQAGVNSVDAEACISSGALLSQRTKEAFQKSVRSFEVHVSADTCTALDELESTSILGTPADTLSDEQSDMDSLEPGSFSCRGTPVTVSHNTTCDNDMDNSQEFFTEKTSVGTAVNIDSTSGDTPSLPDEQVNTNSIDSEVLSCPSASFSANRSTKHEIKKLDEIVSGKTNDPYKMCVRSSEVAAEGDTWSELLESKSVLSTSKDELVLMDERVNSLSSDVGSPNSPGASSATMNQSMKCEMPKDQEVNVTPQTTLKSLDPGTAMKTSMDKLDSRCGTTGEEQVHAKLTDVDVSNPNNGILKAVMEEDTLDKVEKLHLATLNMKHLIQKARMAVAASRPILQTPIVSPNADHRVSRIDAALEPPELSKLFGPKWEDEISRKLLDFRISSARRTGTIKPVAIQEAPSGLKHYLVNNIATGKENNNAPATIWKEEAHKLHADESTKKSARRPLKSINHN